LLFVHRFPQERRIVSRSDGTYDALMECGSSAPVFEIAIALMHLDWEPTLTP
jgi:hypothetical protein